MLGLIHRSFSGRGSGHTLVAIVLVVIAASMLVLYPIEFHRFGYNHNTALLQYCSQSWPNSLYSPNQTLIQENASVAALVSTGRNTTPVKTRPLDELIAVDVNSTSVARLCIGYAPPEKGVEELSVHATVAGLPGFDGEIKAAVRPQRLTMAESPTEPDSYYFVLVTITTYSAKGYAVLNLPGFCGGIPVVAGLPNSSVTAAGLDQWLTSNHTCAQSGEDTPDALLVASANASAVLVNDSYAQCWTSQFVYCVNILTPS